jgi:nicotinamide-nucleotide amidase
LDSMKIHILAVGSELLTPFFRDTDSLYLTQRLNDLGLEVSAKVTIGDEIENLRLAVRDSWAAADLTFVTGGLGPTDDDRTRETVAEVLGRPLRFDESLLRAIEERFHRRDKIMPPANRKQAEMIEGGIVLSNTAGTAPGQWIEADEGKIIVLLPGPPSELQTMCEAHVWPRLASRGHSFLARKVLKTAGLTESELEGLIDGLYPRDPDRRLTVLASPGQIEMHISAFSIRSAAEAEIRAEALAADLRVRVGGPVFSDDGADLEEVVGRILRSRAETVAVAESCSGGLLCRRLTLVPGSSAYFLEGFVTYGNRAKNERLGIPVEILESHGAVSSETAAAMAAGVRLAARSDYGLAVTGIAGPSGGTVEKPVGLVYVALADKDSFLVERCIFLGDRARVQLQSSQQALDLLRRRLLSRPVS